MLNKLRERAQGESGFTLIELLVVMLIIGLLAAIAIPSFFNQRDKAQDADAKEQARTAQTAMETWSTDAGGTYVGGTAAELKKIEPALPSSGFTVTGTGGTGSPTKTAYRVQTTSKTGNTYAIDKNGTTLTYPCTVASGNGDNRGGCPTGGSWQP